MLRIDNLTWFLWAVWILLLPVNWLVSAAAAACVHEAFHVISVFIFGGKVRAITIGPVGTVIETDAFGGYKEVICALSGPAGSFVLAFLIHQFPMLGLCALLQGVFNLLPVYPMDGGRALRCLLEGLCPEKASVITIVIEILIFGSFFFLGIYVSERFALGYFPCVFCLLGICMALLRKRP